MMFLACLITPEEVHNYEEILVHSFAIGAGKNELGVLLGEKAMGTGDTDITAIQFDKNDNLIINDYINFRIVYLKKDYSFDKVYKSASFSDYLFDTDKLLFGVYGSETYFILNKDNGNVSSFKIPRNISAKYTTTSVFTENVIFSYLKDGSIVSFILEDLEILKYSQMLDSIKTRELFKTNKLDKFTIDSNDKIYLDKKIKNRDYSTMYKYWSRANKAKNDDPFNVPGIPGLSKLEFVNGEFIGEDSDRNTYWDTNKSCIIFNEDGWPIDYFVYNQKNITKPAIHSNGDLYYIARGSKNNKLVLNLYKIERQW